MNTTGHIEQEDLALFAMRLLSADENTALEAHLAECEECRKELVAIRSDLAFYAHSIDLHSPPALSRERLLKQVAKEKKVVPITVADRSPAQFGSAPGSLFGAADTVTLSSKSSSFEEEDDVPRRNVALKALPWLGWAAAAGLAFTAGDLYHQRDLLRGAVTQQSLQMGQLTADAASARQIMDTMTDNSALRVTLNRSQTTPVPQGRVTYIADKGALIFLASNMEPLQPYKTYELWIIPADGRDPVPAGTFRPDEHGNASVIMPPLPKGIPAKAFGVTIEDQGGSQTPTLPIIMVGA